MRYRLPLLCLSLAILLPELRAEVVLIEDWEKYPAGASPDDPWTVAVGQYRDGTIEASTIEPSTLSSGAVSVRLAGTAENGGPSLATSFAPQSGEVTIEFDYFFSQLEGIGLLPSLIVQDTNGQRGLVLNLVSAIPSDAGKLEIVNETDKSGMGTVIGGAVLNEWARVKITLKPSASGGGYEKYDIEIQPAGKALLHASQLPLWEKLIDVAKLEFGWASPNSAGVFYIDNILVSSAPEKTR